MPMKTNTLIETETQVRSRQLKLGVDWHADHFRVVRMCDGQSPQPAQRFTPASFLPFVQKQLTLSMRRFTRLTNAFYKKVENHEHSVAIHYMHYNFCRIHQSLRVTPAMEAGITDHVWELEEIIGLLP